MINKIISFFCLCSIVMMTAFFIPTYGLEFSPPVVVNQGISGCNVQPSMFIDTQGNIYISWTKDYARIYLGMSTDNGATWTSPSIQVVDSTGANWPSLQVGNGNLYIAWDLQTDTPGIGPIMCSVSNDTGDTWSHYQVDDGSVGEKFFPSLVIDQNDILYVIWKDERIWIENAHPYFARSINDGQSWLPQPNVRIDGSLPSAGHSYSAPRMSIDANGILYAVFDEEAYGPSGYDIWFTKSTSGGFYWEVCQNVYDEEWGSASAYPDIACGPEGNLYVVWESSWYTQCIYFIKSTDVGASWSDTTRIASNVVIPRPRIDTDSQGNIYAVWNDWTSNRVNSAMSFNSGSTWSAPICVNDTIGISEYGYPYIHVTPNCSISVVWSDGSNVYFTTSTIPVLVSVPDTTYGVSGDSVTIPVNTQDLTGFLVVSAEFNLTYNSDIITGVDVDTSGTLLSGTDWTWQFNAAGNTVHVYMVGTDTLAGSGTLINLIFAVSPDAGIGEESPLNFEDFMFNQGNPQVITQDGVFIVREIFGTIEGTVTNAATGSPIANAIVTACNTHTCCDTTDVTGNYLMPEVIPDTYDMTVTAIGYNQFDTTGIVLLPGDITEVNFAMLHPEIVVAPDLFDINLYIDTTLDTLLYITNNGNGPLEFNIEVVNRNSGRKASNGRVKSGSGPSSFCRIPDDWIPDSSTSRYAGEIIESHPSFGEPTGFEWDGTYFWQGNWDNYVVKLDSNFNFVAGYIACGDPGMAPTGLSWHNGYLYQGCYLENRIYKIDVSDGYNPVDIIYTPCTGGLLGVEWVGEHLWVTDDCGEYPGLIYECDSLGNMINTWPSPDTVPFGLAYNPYLDIIYLNGWSGGNVYAIDPQTGDWWSAFPTPGSSGGCAGGSFDNRYPVYLWIAHHVDQMLYLTDTGNELWTSISPTSGIISADDTLEATVHFNTQGLTPNFTYEASIIIHNNSIDSLVNIPITMHVTTVGVEDNEPLIPKVFALGQNYPNPFNPQTTISYALPKSCKVFLMIYNIKGQLVETLVNDFQQAGYYSVVWNSEDARSGIYLYRITAGDFTDTKKCVILK